ncbi:MAG: hypothetical protein QOE55_1975, partial [Acidobacteriaceae bacterium]|nr:hypothetical protein [Acidobacteriaceae bacterium]
FVDLLQRGVGHGIESAAVIAPVHIRRMFRCLPVNDGSYAQRDEGADVDVPSF